MKKSIFRILFLLVLAVSCLTLFSCGKKEDTSFTYFRSVDNGGEVFEYVLTVDEKNGTFSVNCDKDTENSYSGTFTYQNGYIILHSVLKGDEYVSVEGEVYSYFTPYVEPTHEHNFVLYSEKEGTCLEKGLKTYRCAECGEEKIESTVLGTHSYVKVSSTEGNCKTKSTVKYRCAHCGDEKIVEGELGDHVWSEDNRDDMGCLQKVSVTRRCLLCDTVEQGKELDEYGSHNYVNGVCTYCFFDENGLCHKHDDSNGDGVCEDCLTDISILNELAESGVSFRDDVLYFGAFPCKKSVVSVEIIEKDGKKDEKTGYIRYQNASYSIIEKGNKKEAFIVQPIKWNLLTTNVSSETYVCSSVISAGYFLSPTKIKTEQKVVEENKKTIVLTEYYNIKTGENGEKIKANDFLYSDAYAYLNGEFIEKAFSEKQKGILTPDFITLPDKSFAEETTVPLSDYTSFLLNTSHYFTLTAGEKSNEVFCDSLLKTEEKTVTSLLGFVPVITIKNQD